jgi:hypothetical protein
VIFLSKQLIQENLNFVVDTESDIPGYYTRRGCVENLPGGGRFFMILTMSGLLNMRLSISGTCQDDDPYCKICNEANCNNEIIPDTRHSCRKCGGNICSNEEQVKEEKCGVFEDGDDSCITLFEEGSFNTNYGDCNFQQSNVNS